MTGRTPSAPRTTSERTKSERSSAHRAWTQRLRGLLAPGPLRTPRSLRIIRVDLMETSGKCWMTGSRRSGIETLRRPMLCARICEDLVSSRTTNAQTETVPPKEEEEEEDEEEADDASQAKWTGSWMTGYLRSAQRISRRQTRSETNEQLLEQWASAKRLREFNVADELRD